MYTKGEKIVVTDGPYKGTHGSVIGVVDESRCVVQRNERGVLVVNVKHLAREEDEARRIIETLPGDDTTTVLVRALVTAAFPMSRAAFLDGQARGADPRRALICQVIDEKGRWADNPDMWGGSLVAGYEVLAESGEILLTGGQPVPKIEETS